jgi:hypothetical protein
MIEEALNIKLNPKKVLKIEATDEEVLELIKKLHLINPGVETFEKARAQHMRSEEYFYYAIYRGYQEGLRNKELISFASLITSLIPGLGVSFSTDAYFNEMAIEYRAVDQYNLLQAAGADPLTIARGVVEFLLKEYEDPEPAQLIKKSGSFTPNQIRRIQEEGEGSNFSEKLRNIVDDYFKKS